MPDSPSIPKKPPTLTDLLAELTAITGQKPEGSFTRSQAVAALEAARRTNPTGKPAPVMASQPSEIEITEQEIFKLSGDWNERYQLQLAAARLSHFSPDAARLPVAKNVLAEGRAKQSADNEAWKTERQNAALAKLGRPPVAAVVASENDRLIALLEDKEARGVLPQRQRLTLRLAREERDGKTYSGAMQTIPSSSCSEATPSAPAKADAQTAGKSRLQSSIEAGLAKQGIGKPVSSNSSQAPAGRRRLEDSIAATLVKR